MELTEFKLDDISIRALLDMGVKLYVVICGDQYPLFERNGLIYYSCNGDNKLKLVNESYQILVGKR